MLFQVDISFLLEPGAISYISCIHSCCHHPDGGCRGAVLSFCSTEVVLYLHQSHCVLNESDWILKVHTRLAKAIQLVVHIRAKMRPTRSRELPERAQRQSCSGTQIWTRVETHSAAFCWGRRVSVSGYEGPKCGDGELFRPSMDGRFSSVSMFTCASKYDWTSGDWPS